MDSTKKCGGNVGVVGGSHETNNQRLHIQPTPLPLEPEVADGDSGAGGVCVGGLPNWDCLGEGVIPRQIRI